MKNYISGKINTTGKYRLTLHKAIELLTAIYEEAQNTPYVRNPLAYALYKVWKLADKEGARE